MDQPKECPRDHKDHNLVESKDTDSDVSERCWEAKHRTDSRKWLIRDGDKNSLHTEQVSTMKENFSHPEPISPLMGRRAKLLLNRMMQEAEIEAKAEQIHKPVVEEYISTYDDTYCVSDPPDFEPKEQPRLRELYEKYPLYGNPATSYWQFQHDKYLGDRRMIPGATPIVDINNPFKRNTNFSKPIEDCMDGRQVDC